MNHARLVRPLLGTLASLSLVAAATTPALAADSITWTRQAPATSPAFRAYFGMAYDSARSRTVLYGGQLHGGAQSHETWEWDGNNWTLVQTLTSPSATNGFTMAYDSLRHVTVLFGGQYNIETWEWDGTNWTQRTSAHTPLGRTSASMAFDSARGKTVLFGGAGFINGTFTQLNDTWEWDGTDWTQASPATSPVLRDEAAMTYDSARHVAVLFGGYSPNGYRLSDTWEWDGLNWTQRTSTSTPPSRWGHTMVYDTVERASLIFGGSGDNGELNDAWTWDGSNWSQAPATSAAPSIRTYHGMSFDSGHGVSVVFGGYSFSLGEFADTWTGAFSPVKPMVVSGSSLNATEGTAASGMVATFSGGAGPYIATVNWGDGSSSAGSVSGSTVSATHTYAEEGSFAISVSVTDSRGASATGTASASVADASLSVTGIGVTAERKEAANRVVASFRDADPDGKPSDYRATIEWGDGTAPQPAFISTLDGKTFYVVGSHAYTARGTYVITTRVADSGGYVAGPVISTAKVS